MVGGLLLLAYRQPHYMSAKTSEDVLNEMLNQWFACPRDHYFLKSQIQRELVSIIYVFSSR